MNDKENVAALHLENELWKKELVFYKDELQILEKYLFEVNNKNVSKDARAEVEHYQNQLILHKEVMDELVKEVKDHEKSITYVSDQWHNVEIQKLKLDEHADVKDRVKTQREIYSELKHNFRSWLIQRL